MQQPAQIPLKATFLEPNAPQESKERIEKALSWLVSVDSLRDDQLKEVKKLLAEDGLDLKFVIGKYKELVSQKIEKVKASDVLKALERVERLWGLNDGSDQLQIRALTQTKTASEITTTLIEVTGKTQEYIKKLQERDNA